MSKEVLIRDVPSDVLQHIDSVAKERGVSRQVVLLSILKQTAPTKRGDNKTKKARAKASSREFTFIDLFAGIGGFRFALESFGGQCVYSSEWDKFAKQTYEAWFGEVPHGDIMPVEPNSIPDHFILAAGFPCQPFSIAGVSKKNSLGRKHGFDDDKQGNLFFKLADIIEAKRPPVLLLENVKNLKSHDRGNTWRVIKERLESLDYDIHADIIDAAHWVPQHRERIFIIGFDKNVFGEKVAFEFPKSLGHKKKLRDILEDKPDDKFTLSANLWNYLQAYAEKHRQKGNGFGFGMPELDGITRTLSARYYKDGSEILIQQGRGKRPRKLTPKECQRLMGYPNKPIAVSDTQAYKQFGNGVVVPVVKAVAKEIFTAVDGTRVSLRAKGYAAKRQKVKVR
jgi:DNA (cytosine-5)-methyltransferase 1